MKVYKLFKEDMTTRMSNHVWSIGPRLDLYYGGVKGCASGVIHYYESPEMAALISPIHVGSDHNCLFECEVEHPIGSDGVKHWAKDIRLIRKLTLPTYTSEQRVKFAILCALEVTNDNRFISWANEWLSNGDRSYRTADIAYAAYGAYGGAKAAKAAYATAYGAAKAAKAAYGGAYAAYAGAKAAYGAYAAYGDKPLNFSKIIAKL